ncbi:MAG: carbohydrate binding domain-containing protein [Bacteroidota bacterium]
MKNLLIIPLLICLMIGQKLSGQNFTDGFNFYLPPYDSTTQRFLPKFPIDPIGPNDGVSVDNQGNFIVNGQPIRFWGSNLTTGGCFPIKSKTEGVVGRMRKMGLNLMRFHHMDNRWFDPDGSLFFQGAGQNTRTFNPTTLDRFDFLLAKMKEQGVYANINLLVARTFTTADGVADADSIGDLSKGVTYFDPQLIFLQKEYASQLLNHVNPYTGIALKDDPVLAMVEIANENTLYGYWKGNRLQTYPQGGSLINRHVRMLDSMWQDFLVNKYLTQNALNTAWDIGTVAAGQNELLQDGGFESGNVSSNWIAEQHNGVSVSVAADNNNPFEGSWSSRIDVSNAGGTDWHAQFKQAGLSVDQDTQYVVTFAARASVSRDITVSLMRDNSPYTWYGGTALQIGPNWQEYTLVVTAPEDNIGQVRLSFSLGQSSGSVWIDKVSISDPEIRALDTGEDLSNRNIRRIPYREKINYTVPRLSDMAEFYLGIQRTYYQDFRSFLKDSLGLHMPITGTNALVGPADVISMDELDYLDDHNYWDHPIFPNTPWSGTDWFINNTSALKDPNVRAASNIFGGLAYANRPYTISEYNHGYPNIYEVEMMPLITAYASFHEADGIMFFDYSGQNDGWEQDFHGGYFSIHRDNAIMALSPAYAYAYRNALIRPASNPIHIDYSEEYVYNLPPEDNLGRWGKYYPYASEIGLTHSIRTGSYQGIGAPDLDLIPAPASDVYTTDNGETTLNTMNGLLTTRTPQFISVAGFLQDNTGTDLGEMELVNASDFGVIAWLSLSGDSLDRSKESLISISSRQQNSNMIWNGNQTVNFNWGSSPTEQKPLSLKLKLRVNADSLRISPLDASGAVTGTTTYASSAPGVFVIDLEQSQDQSLWYGVEAVGIDISLDVEDLADQLQLRAFPVPAKETIFLQYSLNKRTEVSFSLNNQLGQSVFQSIPKTQFPGPQQEKIEVAHLASGMYYLDMQIGTKRLRKKLFIQ